MGFKNKTVATRLDRKFFDTVFEPKRKELEKELGIKITQNKFSGMIKGFKLNLKLPRSMNNVRTRKLKKK